MRIWIEDDRDIQIYAREIIFMVTMGIEVDW